MVLEVQFPSFQKVWIFARMGIDCPLGLHTAGDSSMIKPRHPELLVLAEASSRRVPSMDKSYSGRR